MVKNNLRNRLSTKLVVALALVLMVTALAIPTRSNAQVAANVATNGFGAAFAYAQTIGPVSYAQAGSIGNGQANAQAVTPFSAAVVGTLTNGPAAAAALAIGSPFGSSVTVQSVSFFGGFAAAAGVAFP